MNKSLKWKILLLLSVIAFSGVTLLSTFYKNTPEWWHKVAPTGLHLGLDLQGGMHLVLKVDLDKAIENSLDFAAQDLKNQLLDQRISVVRTASANPNEIIFTLPNSDSLQSVKDIVKGDFPNLDIDVQADEGSFPRIIITLKKDQIDFIHKNAVNQSLEIIRNRIDQFGVSEPVIVRQGEDEIIVQLPGVKDPDRALSLIGQTAQLEFKVVDGEGTSTLPALISQAENSGQWHDGESRKKLNQVLAHSLPSDARIYFEKEVDPETKLEKRIPLLLKNQVLMTGDMVKDAQVRVGGSFNEPYVSLDLTGRGGKVFAKITEKFVNQRLAIVLDGVVRSAPVIREKIMGGSAQISGSFTYEDATDLAIILRVGALPAPVSIVQNLTVGASLGQDSIDKGISSGLLGAVLVLIFMVVYYRMSGVIANLALILNIFFLFAGLAALQATLTLPGIAGIILSIGMAVDSNVLIFERMREEFAIGKSVKSGVEGGYDMAFWTIVDSQVTTLITALALFLFGTGPIKGFAVTLSLGVTFNLFTTLFATRLAYEGLYNMKMLKPLKFLQFAKKTKINFMGVRKVAFVLSGTLVLLGLVAFVQLLGGHGNIGVDFSGGTILQYKADKPFELVEIRDIFKDNGMAGIDLQPVSNENRLIVKMKKSTKVIEDNSEQITTMLNSSLPDHNFVLESKSEIGSSVSEMLRDKALQAIAISLLGVILYLALRFDFRFGVAAAIATFHDVVVVLGICWIMNLETNLLIVTALLTLAGYSLNDSVVIFDRIRENMHKDNLHLDFAGIINLSINEVLGRTIVTSLTTLLVLLALFLLGGSVIHDFSFALLAGVIVGTYSSVFIASPVLHLWQRD